MKESIAAKKDDAIRKLRALKDGATDSECQKIDAAVDIMAALSIFLVSCLTPTAASNDTNPQRSSYGDDLLNVVTLGFWKR